MPITKIEFVYIDKESRTCIFVENCANGNRKTSHTARLQGTAYKDANIINVKIFNKYKELAKIQKATA